MQSNKNLKKTPQSPGMIHETAHGPWDKFPPCIPAWECSKLSRSSFFKSGMEEAAYVGPDNWGSATSDLERASKGAETVGPGELGHQKEGGCRIEAAILEGGERNRHASEGVWLTEYIPAELGDSVFSQPVSRLAIQMHVIKWVLQKRTHLEVR